MARWGRPLLRCTASVVCAEGELPVGVFTQISSEICDVRVLTDSVGRTLGLNSSAGGRPFRVRFCRHLWQVPIYRSFEFRGKL
jgi:hypothetical protein